MFAINSKRPPLIIGLTGGIATGKSEAAKIFQSLDISVIDADSISHQITTANSNFTKKIIEYFGNKILNSDKSLNRSLIKKIIFSNKNKRMWLENLLHPEIINQMLTQAQKAKSKYCVLIIPLLLENNLTHIVDRILIIDADEKIQIARLKERENISDALIQKILNAQTTRETRLKIADDVIENNNDLERLKKQILSLHKKYLSLADKKIKFK